MIHDKGAAVAWWASLQPDPARKRPGDRAALARLRRCATVAEAMYEQAAIDLFRACDAGRAEDLEAVGLTAAVLAHVREDLPGMPVARQLGPQGQPDAIDTAAMKPLRFQRLMTASTSDELMSAMRRLVALADRRLNVRDLSVSLLDWSEPCRRRWTYDYWGAGQSAASHTSTLASASAKDTAA